jgi:hypothetical protein
MVGHLLRHFELAAVPEIFRDPRGPEAVAADLCMYLGIFGAAADHAVNVRLVHGPLGELLCAPVGRAEEITFRVRRDPRTFYICLQVLFKAVVARHLVTLAAFFMEAHPGAAALNIHLFHTHFDNSPDPREGIDHKADQGPVAQAHG